MDTARRWTRPLRPTLPMRRSSRLRMLLAFALAPVVATAAAAPLQGQSTLRQQVRGTVVDAVSELPVEGATVQVDVAQGASTATSRDGRFLLNNVPDGDWDLLVTAPGFFPQSNTLNVELGGQLQVEVRLDPDERARVAALVGGNAPTGEDPIRDLGYTVDGVALRAVARTSEDVGELIESTVPALRMRGNGAGVESCFEFPVTEAGASRGMREARLGENLAVVCHHPDVYLDGVLISQPSALYDWASPAAVRRVQAIPPEQTGDFFGAAPWGVLLVDTNGNARAAIPGLRASGSDLFAPVPSSVTEKRALNFDWSQDPAGHSFGRAFLGAVAGNAAGLAAGLAVGRQCVYIEDRTEEIEFSCGNAGVAGAGFAAVALPALGSAMGARLAGRTDRSRGRLVPAMVGAGMGVLPGYIFTLSTVGGGVETMNALGRGFLLVGAPLLTTLADRLFRELR